MNHLQHKRSSGPGAIECYTLSACHVQHAVLHAMCGMKGLLSY